MHKGGTGWLRVIRDGKYFYGCWEYATPHRAVSSLSHLATYLHACSVLWRTSLPSGYIKASYVFTLNEVLNQSKEIN